jgi:diaminobutyrate-2-oxoglutarate transaminase
MSREIAEDELFQRYESEVRSYCRTFPVVFAHAKGSYLYDRAGRAWLDFFAGAGTLNYGHNPERVKAALVRYLDGNGVLHALDMYTVAKARFLDRFATTVLAPRRLDYKVQFCGPTGANAVEAALKLARKVTGRHGIVAFSGSYHGMSMGALAVSAGLEARAAAGTPLGGTTFLPYPCGWGPPVDGLELFERLLSDPMSGVERPAAVIVETVQLEGGVQVAPAAWLARLRKICDQHGVLLIVDDIQAGCGRTGTFFSFERAGIVPDLVTVSKAIGGCGMPMALVLIRRDHDRWTPGEHTGTFRGNQLSFVAAAAALEHWEERDFTDGLARKAALVDDTLRRRAQRPGIAVRGLGLAWGIDCAEAGGGATARRVQELCFAAGLIVERCGRGDTVVKLLPPLTATLAELVSGLDIVTSALDQALAERSTRLAVA